MSAFGDRLAVGAARGLGPVPAIVQEALVFPELIEELVRTLNDKRPVVVERAANALKKLHMADTAALNPYAGRLLQAAISCDVLQARWNLTIVISQLPHRRRKRALAIELMFEALQSDSSLIRTFALQGLYDLSAKDGLLRSRLRPLLKHFVESGTAAVRARARKLLLRLERNDVNNS